MTGALTSGAIVERWCIGLAEAERFARIALAGIEREYPNHIVHLMSTDQDAAPPRVLHPAFFGCFDWHSAVHTHWLLVRLLALHPALESRAAILAALARTLEPGRLRVEAAYLTAPDRQGFERPYGLAWLLRLDAELAVSSLEGAAGWRAALVPVAAAARANLLSWLPKLTRPVRSGTHNQTAFAAVLLHDCASLIGDQELESLIRERTLAFFREDVDAPLGYEPSGEDFLSPCLMEAHVIARLLEPDAFAAWLTRFLPGIPVENDPAWLSCAQVTDERDGRLVHLHGLNLSRAWNLRGIAARLPAGDPRAPALNAAANRHIDAGLPPALAAEHYAGSHWLPTFAVLAVSANF
jgi:hypothetical protein